MSENPFESARVSASIRLPNLFVLLRGIGGGVVGGAIGFFVVRWLAQQGMYGMMIPGAMIGLGAGLAARGRSVVLGVICAVAAITAAIFIEWTVFHPRRELSFFLAHLHQLPSITVVMIGLGGVFAFWLGQGR